MLLEKDSFKNFTTILIDFDGTVCFDRFWRSIDRGMQEQIRSYLFGQNDKLVN